MELRALSLPDHHPCFPADGSPRARARATNQPPPSLGLKVGWLLWSAERQEDNTSSFLESPALPWRLSPLFLLPFPARALRGSRPEVEPVQGVASAATPHFELSHPQPSTSLKPEKNSSGTKCPPCQDPGARAPWFHMTPGLRKMKRKIWGVLLPKGPQAMALWHRSVQQRQARAGKLSP